MDLQTAGEWRRGEQLQKFEEEWELEAAANEWSVIQLNWVQNSHFVPVLPVMLLSGGKWGLVLLQLVLLGLNVQEIFFVQSAWNFYLRSKAWSWTVWMRACADSSMYTTWRFFVGSALDLNRDLLLSVYSTLTNMGQLSKCQLRVFLRLNSSNRFFWGPESSRCLLQLLQ
jgi:hypothetical protein